MTRVLDLRAGVDPDAVRTALAAHVDDLATATAPHHTAGLASVRHALHRDHEIEVRTTYTITVDGRPFDVHLTVDNAGRVHYHGLPTRDFASVIDLVAKAIDAFPEDFPTPGADSGPVDLHGGSGHGSSHWHGG